MTFREALTNRFTAYVISPVIFASGAYAGFDYLHQKTLPMAAEKYQASLKDIDELTALKAEQANKGIFHVYQAVADRTSNAAVVFSRCVKQAASSPERPQLLEAANKSLMLSYPVDEEKVTKCIESQLTYWGQTTTPEQHSKIQSDVTKLFMGLAIFMGLGFGRELRKSAPTKIKQQAPSSV